MAWQPRLYGSCCLLPPPYEALKGKWEKPQSVSPYLNQEPELVGGEQGT